MKMRWSATKEKKNGTKSKFMQCENARSEMSSLQMKNRRKEKKNDEKRLAEMKLIQPTGYDLDSHGKKWTGSGKKLGENDEKRNWIWKNRLLSGWRILSGCWPFFVMQFAVKGIRNCRISASKNGSPPIYHSNTLLRLCSVELVRSLLFD